MSEQPKALQLSVMLRLEVDSTVGVVKYSTALNAASELRRQHAEIERLREALAGMLEQFNYGTITGIVNAESMAITNARAALERKP